MSSVPKFVNNHGGVRLLGRVTSTMNPTAAPGSTASIVESRSSRSGLTGLAPIIFDRTSAGPNHFKRRPFSVTASTSVPSSGSADMTPGDAAQHFSGVVHDTTVDSLASDEAAGAVTSSSSSTTSSASSTSPPSSSSPPSRPAAHQAPLSIVRLRGFGMKHTRDDVAAFLDEQADDMDELIGAICTLDYCPQSREAKLGLPSEADAISLANSLRFNKA